MEIIYFELNNWFCGEHYPNAKPFIDWIGNNFQLAFMNENWVKENKLCVTYSFIDMSVNFCVTATREWVKDNCPNLLTDYKDFLRHPNDSGDVYGRFGDEFLKYEEKNFGIKMSTNDD